MSRSPATIPETDLVATCLVQHGWKGTEGTAIAAKAFQSAVGPKEAHAYLADWGPKSQNLVLSGVYQSEGRNQLESHAILIPKGTDPEGVKAAVTRFAVDADAVIANTYAMGLARIA